MKNSNTQIYDKKVDRAAMIRLYEHKVAGKVSTEIDDHEYRINELILKNKAKITPKVREQIDEELLSSFKNLTSVSSRSLIDLVNDQASYIYQNLEVAVGKVWRVHRPENRIAESIVLERPLYSDMTLTNGWSNIGVAERRRLELVIRKGLSEGMGEKEIALALRKGNVFKITRNQSIGLVRTGMTSVVNQADHEVYKANKGVLQGWQYVALLDARTTEICAFRDGTIYPIDDVGHLPPAHWNCRSSTTPVVKSYAQMVASEAVARIRKKNLEELTPEEIAVYDGLTPLKESYQEWLYRQPVDVQLRHFGDSKKVELFQSGQLTVDKFTNESGRSLTISQLRRLTDPEYGIPSDTRRFAFAKQKLDAIHIGASRPEDFLNDPSLVKALKEYYQLQSGELDGTLSLTNFRGTLIASKKASKRSVLNTPPSEAQLKFNPITRKYDDVRLYQPNPQVLENNLRLVQIADIKEVDKAFITKFVNDLEDGMSMNERAAVADNLRILFTRYRSNGEVWTNFKAVSQGQIKFDVMNVSDSIETQIRKDTNLLKKLKDTNYLDPVLGPTQLQALHDGFIANIHSKNTWEDRILPGIASELKPVFNNGIPLAIRHRINAQGDKAWEGFYEKFARRLSLADMPDRDEVAVSLGRDLYNLANLNGDRKTWWETGVKLLDHADDKGFYKLETYGVQKRRMKSKMGGHYFGPYYDTFAVNIRVVDPRLLKYAELTRKVEVGLRIGVTDANNRLYIREGYKTYFDRYNRDTRIPITSTGSFSDFPEEFVDKDIADALNWTAQSSYKIDEDFFDFTQALLNFEDDKGNAKLFNELNEYRKYIVSRGDAYERFKSMQWLRNNNKSFSNHPFLDHRGRIYDRGFISPQSGESFRPYLNTSVAKNFSEEAYENLLDQTGGFLGGLNDTLEGRYNSLSFAGRQKIAKMWHKDLISLGNAMIRRKPNDIRFILKSDFLSLIDGEEQGKALRFALELAKIDNYLKGDYSAASLARLRQYKTALALEQDASSSGAQIIALTTKNKQLAFLSNVVPTSQKQRLYDEIAAATFNDPKFRELNQKLGLTEKDLRKAAKAQNMVTFYGAGERTGIINVEGKLSKILAKDTDTLVVKASDRDVVLNEISARMARYEKIDPDLYAELKTLRTEIKDIFNKGMSPNDDIMEQLYFLDPKTKDLVEKMTRQYGRVVTPDDFAQIAKIMSENLALQVPILKDFTKFFGRLAEDYLTHAKPKASELDYGKIVLQAALGTRKNGKPIPKWLSRILGIKQESVQLKLLRRLPFYTPNGWVANYLQGVQAPSNRRTGFNVGDYKVFGEDITKGIEIAYANKLPKEWTNVPWVNFDGKTIEQNFTQSFEERLIYKDKDGKFVTNILMVKQKTEAGLWDQLRNRSGKIRDIADVTKARTAFAVNGNHSNDATIVKNFHLWGKKNNISTSTIHDAFFTNAADMLKGREALKEIYSRVLKGNSIKATLDEMYARGLPKPLYEKYLNEAIDTGLIPVVGRSRINGKLLTENDILKIEDILKPVKGGFRDNYGWYGVG